MTDGHAIVRYMLARYMLSRAKKISAIIASLIFKFENYYSYTHFLTSRFNFMYVGNPGCELVAN